jgi:hypothetical protein
MQVRYGRQIKFLKTFEFFKKCPGGLMRKMALSLTAKSWISLPTKQVRVR